MIPMKILGRIEVLLVIVLVLAVLNSVSYSVLAGEIVEYKNNYWDLYTPHGSNSVTAPVINVYNLTVPLAGLGGKGKTEFSIFNVIYLPQSTVFNLSAFVCSDSGLTNISVVIFRDNWMGPYNFSRSIKLNHRSSYAIFLLSGIYKVGIVFSINSPNITELHFCSVLLDISLKNGTILVLRPPHTNLLKSFFVVGRHVKGKDVKSISWIYYQTGNHPARIPVLNLTNYKKTGKRWACFYTNTKNTTLEIKLHAKNLLSKHKLNWYPVELYVWNSSKLDITELKWNKTFFYNGSDYGLVINPTDSWNLSKNLSDVGDNLRCVGVWIKWDPLLNTSVILSLPANSLVGVTNNSNIQQNPRENSILSIEVVVAGLLLLASLLALKRPYLVGRCRFPKSVEELIRRIKGLIRRISGFFQNIWILLFFLIIVVSLIFILGHQLADWGGILFLVLLWVLSVLLLWWIDTKWWIIFGIIFGIIVLIMIIIAILWGLPISQFTGYILFLLPFPFFIRSLRIAWEIIDRGSRTNSRLIRIGAERMKLFLSIVLSIFIGPGMVIMVYASAALLGMINNDINTWQQIIGSSFMISLGTTALLVYECLLMRKSYLYPPATRTSPRPNGTAQSSPRR